MSGIEFVPVLLLSMYGKKAIDLLKGALMITLLLNIPAPILHAISRTIKSSQPPEPPSQGTPTQQQEYIAGMMGYMMNMFMYMMPIMMTFMSMTMITNLLTKTFTE